MVYFLGDWGMGDSDCTSFQQHVPNIQQSVNVQNQRSQQHLQHEQQREAEFKQQHVGQIAPTLSQLPKQFGSASNSSNFLGSNVPSLSTVATTPASGQQAASTQNVFANSTLVVADLQQLSVNNSNNNSNCSTPIESQQSKHTLASAAIALHQYLGSQRSEPCAGHAICAEFSINQSSTPLLGSTLTATLHTQISKDLLESEDEVALQPLSNQVGGHTRLLLLNQSTVIKPLNLRELDFYQNIPHDVQKFVPKYKGVMQATTMGGAKLEKRYSPSFREEPARKMSTSKRKRDDVLRYFVIVFVKAGDCVCGN